MFYPRRSRRPFEVLLFRPESGGWEVDRTVRRRSRVAARVTARKLLAPRAAQVTRYTYHEEARRLWLADVYAPGGTHESLEAERIIVPSVGEIGVW